MLHAGERIGPLVLERSLGVGGMGEVYLARDERLERLVAVKLLPSSRSLDPDARGRMLREARAASALNHPSIVTVHDVGDHDGRAYIVMEYVDGETFDAMIARRGALPPDEAIELLAAVADAVATAHAAGVLHRDLKSANLMLDKAGRVKVLDFGLSKRTDGPASQPPRSRVRSPSLRPPLRDVVDASAVTVSPDADSDDAHAETVMPTSSDGPIATITASNRSDEPMTEFGARMGTPGWAPPELMDGLTADVRSDVFALGCVLYHLLAGTPPFPGRSWSDVRDRIDRGAAPLTKAPALDAVVRSALAVDPERRPAGARELVDAARKAIRPARRGPVIAAIAAGAAVIGGAAIVIATRGGDDAKAPAAIDAGAAPALPHLPAPAPRKITTTGGCAYSPTFLDDDTIAFDLTKDGKVDLYMLDVGVANASPTQLTTNAGWEWRSSRGATDTEVIFLVQGDGEARVDAMDVLSGARRMITEDNGPAVHTAGAYYYAPSSGNVIRERKGDQDKILVTLPAGAAVDTLIASPDGALLGAIMLGEQRLPQLCTIPIDQPVVACVKSQATTGRAAFSSTSRALYFDGPTGIERYRLDTDTFARAVPDVSGLGGIAVARTGATMVYSDCGARTEIFDVLTDAAKPVVDDIAAGYPSFGPDGVMAYVHSKGRDFTVMVRQPDGTVRELVGRPDARFSDLAFSPDGRYLAYFLDTADAPGIYVATIGSNATPNRITDSQRDDQPVFAGDDIIFTRRDDTGAPLLMRAPIAGGDPVVASKRPRFTVAADLVRGRVLVSSPAQDFLYWWDPATGKETPGPKLEFAPHHLALSPSGDYLLVLAGGGGQEVYRYATAKPAERELVYTLSPDHSSRSAAIDDRGHPFVSVDRWAGELWQIDAPSGTPW